MNKEIIEVMDNASLANVKEQREAILALEAALMDMPDQIQDEIPVKHCLHGGCYIRSVTVPAGVMLTGEIYKYDHTEIMAHGRIIVTTDEGKSRELEGFHVMPAKSGKKRAAYTLEETTWITVHTVTNIKSDNPEVVHSQLTVDSFEEFEALENKEVLP